MNHETDHRGESIGRQVEPPDVQRMQREPVTMRFVTDRRARSSGFVPPATAAPPSGDTAPGHPTRASPAGRRRPAGRLQPAPPPWPGDRAGATQAAVEDQHPVHIAGAAGRIIGYIPLRAPRHQQGLTPPCFPSAEKNMSFTLTVPLTTE